MSVVGLLEHLLVGAEPHLDGRHGDGVLEGGELALGGLEVGLAPGQLGLERDDVAELGRLAHQGAHPVDAGLHRLHPRLGVDVLRRHVVGARVAGVHLAERGEPVEGGVELVGGHRDGDAAVAAQGRVVGLARDRLGDDEPLGRGRDGAHLGGGAVDVGDGDRDVGAAGELALEGGRRDGGRAVDHLPGARLGRLLRGRRAVGEAGGRLRPGVDGGGTGAGADSGVGRGAAVTRTAPGEGHQPHPDREGGDCGGEPTGGAGRCAHGDSFVVGAAAEAPGRPGRFPIRCLDPVTRDAEGRWWWHPPFVERSAPRPLLGPSRRYRPGTEPPGHR